MTTDWLSVRERLQDVIVERYGEVSTRTVRVLAHAAGAEYSTVARFLHFYETHRTERLQGRTLESLARELRVHPGWLRHGVGARQLGFWPHVVQRADELEALDPVDELQRSIKWLANFPRDARLQICRAAIAAMLEASAQSGTILPLGVYRSLMRLDACREVA